MKVYSLKCPSCGASVKFDPKKPIKFCAYCGDQILFDDGVKRSEHKIYKYSEQVIRDEARVEEAKARAEEAKAKVRLAKNDTIDTVVTFLLAIGGFLLIGLLGLLGIV